MIARSRDTQLLARLTPAVVVREADDVVVLPLLAAVPAASLGEIVGSLAPHRDALIAAVGLPVTGS